MLAGLRNEVILVKGSRAFHFDRISDRLELKVHENHLEINLNALVDKLELLSQQTETRKTKKWYVW